MTDAGFYSCITSVSVESPSDELSLAETSSISTALAGGTKSGSSSDLYESSSNSLKKKKRDFDQTVHAQSILKESFRINLRKDLLILAECRNLVATPNERDLTNYDLQRN